MRATARIAPALPPLVLAVALGLAGCSDDEGEGRSSAIEPAELPANLCAVVPPDLVAKWELQERVHDTKSSRASATAACTLSGSYLGKAIEVDLRLISFAGDDNDAARKAMSDGVSSLCGELRADPPAFTEDDNDCRLRTPDRVTQVARSIPAHGVSRVEASFGGENEAGVAAEVERLTGMLSTTDPADLG